MSMFPLTRAATGYVARNGPGGLARARTAVLLTRLGACEDAHARDLGLIP
jgi:hypothetical protein